MLDSRLILAVAAAGMLFSCGNMAEESYDVRSGAQEGRLDYTAVDIGVGIRSGDLMAMANFNPGEYSAVTSGTPHGVLHVKSYDAAAQSFGEYITYPAPMDVTARTPIDFSTNLRAGSFGNRVNDLYEETTTWSSEAGAEDFASKTVVLDFWRWRKDWWVRWDGNLEAENNRVGQGPYGFNRQQLVEDLLDDVEQVASDHQPRYFIIGDEIERLLQTETTGGIAPAELSNFMAFFQQARERIRQASPNTKIGVGFRWERFANRVAPLYAADEGDDAEATLERAFEIVLMPFIERSDVVALSVYSEPGEDPANFAFLSRLEELFEVEKPVVYYEVGSPVTTVVDYQSQATFLEDFARWNSGVNVEFVAWRSLLNFDGTDTNDQMVRGRCAAFTGSERDFEIDLSNCYDGLYTSVFSSKPAFDVLAGE